MEKRIELLKKIEQVRQDQETLAQLELSLCKEYLQISDEQQWFKEEKRTCKSGRGKRTILEGRFYWYQSMTDEGTGKVIKIERSRPIKENGKWDDIAVINLVI